MVRLGLNSAIQSDGQSSSQAQSRPQTRASLTEKDTQSFTDFRQRWMSERPTSQSRVDRPSGLGSSRLQRNDGAQWLNRGRKETTGMDSALSKLRDLRQMREPTLGCHTGNRNGLSTSNRSNLSLTERLTQSSCGINQPMFQRHRTTASQLREIKQIARDGSIITKMSQTAAIRRERNSVTRPRTGSGSSVLSESYLATRQSATTEISDELNSKKQKENEQGDADDPLTSLSSKMRRQRRPFGDRSLETVEQKLSQARDIIGTKMSRTSMDVERPSEASILLQKLQRDSKKPLNCVSTSSEVHEEEATKTTCIEGGKHEEASAKHDSLDKGISTNTDNERVEKTEVTKMVMKEESELIEQGSHGIQEHSFERSRLIASRIFEKLESKKHSETATKLGLRCKMESGKHTSTKLDAVSSDLEEKSDQRVGSKQNRDVMKHELKKEAFEVKITTAKPIQIPGLDQQLQRKEGSEEVTENNSLRPEGLETQSVDVRKIRKIVEMGLNDSGANLTPLGVSLKRSPTVSPKPSPPITPKPAPKSSIVLGSGEKIRVAVELHEDEKSDEENETEERGESSIEVPAQQSVASLRSSLFGGSSSSLENMLSRGMGGTLSASPVVFRKKQVTERRQVVSSVEVTKHGMASMSMTHSFRVERKSESDATRKAEEAELLPTLYTRFEKPKKPGSASRTRKSGLEPITLSLKLSNDADESD